MSTRTALIVFLAPLAALPLACSPDTLPRSIPDDIKNPIALTVRGGTPGDIVGAVTQVMATLTIPLDIADRSDGQARTRWIDVAEYIRGIREGYPSPQERVVRYHFTVREGRRADERRLEIFVGYRPFRTTARDRAVPQQHPGMMLALRIRDELIIELIEANMEVPRETEEEGEEEDGNGGRP